MSASGMSTPVAYVTGLDPRYQNTDVYFRDNSYGNYTGTGWDVAPKYQLGTFAFVYQALRKAGVSAPQIRIQREKNCSAIVPYYSDLTDWGNDCYLDNDHPMSYTVGTCVDWNYHSLKKLQTAGQYTDEEAAYRAFVYENYLQIPSSTKKALLAWAKERGITKDSADLVTLIQAAVQHGAAYNLMADPYPKDVDVAVYFLTVAKEGICQHFATAATLLYRAFGIPARYTVGFRGEVTNGVSTALTPMDAHAWVEIYVDGLGWVPVEVTGSGGFPTTKAPVQVQIASLTKYYDGKPFTAEEIVKYAVLSGFLLPGHTLELELPVDLSGAEPGTWISKPLSYRVVDENGVDVTDLFYDIQVEPGTLSILPRKITVTTGSASKYYDGNPLQCGDYWISQGSLAPGETLQLQLPAILTEPGTALNQAEDLKILASDPNGKPVNRTHCYEITVICGILEVQPALQAAPPQKRREY